MVWDKLRTSSFEFDEDMIESLFGYNLHNTNEDLKSKSPSPKSCFKVLTGGRSKTAPNDSSCLHPKNKPTRNIREVAPQADNKTATRTFLLLGPLWGCEIGGKWRGIGLW
nr:formin-like protein 11 [Tanacetum cinerariifolium]